MLLLIAACSHHQGAGVQQQKEHFASVLDLFIPASTPSHVM
jgi:hypothetical protein